MTHFDTFIITLINGLSQSSFNCDSMVKFIAMNKLFKGGIFMVIIWWSWFKYEKNEKIREHILITIFSGLAALFLTRILSLSLPFRPRPIHNPEMKFKLPYSMVESTLVGWSSFPSDHSALFITLAIGIFFISRKMGIYALFYSALVICFPRIYLGLHYPSDVMCGALIGSGIGILFHYNRVISSATKLCLVQLKKYPYVFYTIFFIISYQMANLFEEIRSIMNASLKIFLQI